MVWSALILPSAIIGAVCGFFVKGGRGLFLGAAIPWFGLLAVLLFYEFCVPYQGGGASMWPIAQLFGGTIVAITGLIVSLVTKHSEFGGQYT